MPRLVAIVGPTATGKSNLALQLALRVSGEIIGADSRQVYRHMDIGTAKPSAETRALVPHHLIDVVELDQDFSLALYQQMARQVIDDIWRRGKLPIIAGGTGLYVWSVVEGWQLPPVSPHPELRRSLEARAARDGGDELYHELEATDPEAAQRIDRRNLRRVIRALEICASGIKPSQFWRKPAPLAETLLVGLTAPRHRLYQRIDARVDAMMAQGLVPEVQGLLARGYNLGLPSMSGLGYQQIGLHLRGQLRLDEAVARIKHETHRFARHQYAWFHLRDRRIHWFDIETDFWDAVWDLVQRFLDSEVEAAPLPAARR